MHHNEFTIRNTLRHAWQVLHGSKAALWAVNGVILALFILVTIVTMLVASMHIDLSDPHALTAPLVEFVLQLLFSVFLYAVVAPFAAGIFMLSVRRARGDSIEPADGFRYLRYWLPIAVILIIIALIVVTINTLMSIPIAYFSSIHSVPGVALAGATGLIAVLIAVGFVIFSIPALIDKGLTIKEAFAYSCKTVRTHWVTVFGVLVAYYAVFVLALLPTMLGMLCPVAWVKLSGAALTIVAMVWLLPYMQLILGTAYHLMVDKPGH